MSDYYIKNKESRLEYQKEYNELNKDKIKEYQHFYWVNVRKKKYVKKLKKPKMVKVKVKIIKPPPIVINNISDISGVVFFN
jgi:hypothetical protein